MGGFLSRFRVKRNAEAPEQPSDGSLPEKITSGDLPAEGNDVAIESIEISHEGLELDDSSQGNGVSVKYTMFLPDSTPVRSDEDGPSTLARLVPQNGDAGDGTIIQDAGDVSDIPDTDNSDHDPDLDDDN